MVMRKTTAGVLAGQKDDHDCLGGTDDAAPERWAVATDRDKDEEMALAKEAGKTRRRRSSGGGGDPREARELGGGACGGGCDDVVCVVCCLCCFCFVVNRFLEK